MASKTQSSIKNSAHKKNKKDTSKNTIWNLSDLYSSIHDKNILKDLEKTHKESKVFNKKYKAKLNSLSSTKLKEAYIQLEDIISSAYKVSQYIHLEYAINTNDNKIKSLVSQIDEKESEIFNELVFFDLEIGSIDSATVKKHKSNKALSNYHYDISLNKKHAKHNLTEPEEKLSNLKNLTGVSAFRKLYNDLTASFEFKFKVNGKLKTLNGSELRALRLDKNKSTRRNAMKLFFSKYEENQTIFTHIFNNILKHQETEKKLRKYPNPISIRNTRNDINNKAIETLHKVTTNSNHLVETYYTLKSKIMKCPDLTLADIYAPMPKFQKTYTFNDAKQIILDSFKEFDPDIAKLTKTMFDENRIHAPVKKYKRGGAFCSASTPDIKPYVMMNFQGKFSDVTTLAHELGHAIHDMLASKQSIINYHPILPLAETASVFFEMVVTDYLLKQESDNSVIQAILIDKLEDIFATSHRQNMFSNFENDIHDAVQGNWLSSKDFCNIYEKSLKKMFGKSIHYTPEYNWEWSTIPHMIESPFYVYAYNFGNLLVFSLYQQYLEEGSKFVPKLKQLLAMGSAKDPKTICKSVNANIEDPKFWEKSINYIENMLTRLKKLS